MRERGSFCNFPGVLEGTSRFLGTSPVFMKVALEFEEEMFSSLNFSDSIAGPIGLWSKPADLKAWRAARQKGPRR